MKITFGAVVTDGSGKLGGHCIQHGQAGAILRSIAQPTKKVSVNQSFRHQDVQVISQTWRTLTESDRLSWNSNAEPGQSGFDLFMSTNLRLLSVGYSIIPSYIPPVARPPFLDLLRSYIEYYPDPLYPYLGFSLFNYFDAYPITGWKPYILFRGWILPSQYSFKNNRQIPNDYLIYGNEGGINVSFYTFDSINFAPPGDNAKGILDINLINESTGQLVNLGTFNISAVNSGYEPLAYDPNTNEGTYTVQPVTGGYNLTIRWISPINAFNISEWEPHFYMSEWVDTLSTDPLPATNYLTPSHFTQTNSGLLTMLIPKTDGPPYAFPGIGKKAAFQIGWRNVNNGQLVSEKLLSLLTF